MTEVFNFSTIPLFFIIYLGEHEKTRKQIKDDKFSVVFFVFI